MEVEFSELSARSFAETLRPWGPHALGWALSLRRPRPFAAGMSRGWIFSLVLGSLTVLLGIFLLTLQFCVAAIVGPGGEPQCIATYPAFLCSGSAAVILGGFMVGMGFVSYMGQRRLASEVPH